MVFCDEILIVSITPYFLDRGVLWYDKNYEKIKKANQGQIWWKENTLFLEKDLQINLFALLRRLTAMGYVKAQTIGAPGELAHRGGIIEIFPINSACAWRLEFLGNKIFAIEPLEVRVLRGEKKIKKDLASRRLDDLLTTAKPGDYLVHLDHGIGRFAGFAQKPGGQLSFSSPDNESSEKFFVLEYAKKDRLYVPLDKEEKLTRYIGFEIPIIHRLGGTLWFKTKRRAKETALELAKELLSLYAERAAARGFKYLPDDELQKQLENDFSYVETDDQAAAVAEVKRDMELEKPMDRLICGDVGFGKTEVALRAAFKAVASGKQVVLLAPTTILANQHFHTFEARLKKFPVRLALLTRLQSKNQQKKIIREITEGKIDILIGTHRLLSSDVVFKNLGLAIIDEEQRFGVRQKERFKKWRSENLPREPRSDFCGVDILSLSATPIPRTLHLTLSGLRDISTITTPPPGRLPIKTFVEPYSEKIVRDVITKELNRGGQIYYLHNRIETIELVICQIKKLLPRGLSDGRQAKIAAIHGRMKEKQLIKIMDDFGSGKINVLVATTIIENGLDFPNVNTLIVANAARLGLAQSYQIRGRIGRSHQQAYAYFLYKTKHLTDDVKARLEALKEAEALGSGYQIALRDLEIRGAGNILGREQSGPINAVGLNLYMQMLNETIEELKNP
jgi:transcription-repair coupling factor (superfamily II helicase)